MTRSIRSIALAAAAFAAASAASAATYQYQFQTYYDPATHFNLTDTKAFDSVVAGMTISDIAGGAQISLKFKDTAFPGSSKGMYLDELWLSGNRNGTLTRVAGDGGTYRYFSGGFTTPEGQRLNWDIDFKDGAFTEGETTTLQIKGNGITAASLLTKAPQIELMNVGSPFNGKFGLNKSIRFIGTLAAIPEPSTYALMGLGLVGVAFAARKRQAA
jgi:PEP-CTERM motif